MPLEQIRRSQGRGLAEKASWDSVHYPASQTRPRDFSEIPTSLMGWELRVCLFQKIKTCRSLKSKNSLFLEYLLHMYCTASQSSCSWTTGTTTPVPAPGQPERREQHSAQHRGPHTPEEGRMSSQECATSGRARVKIPGTGSRIHAWSISRLIGSLSNAWVLINGRNYLLNGE